MQTTVTVTATIDREDGTRTTVIETAVDRYGDNPLDDRAAVAATGETALDRVLARVEVTPGV